VNSIYRLLGFIAPFPLFFNILELEFVIVRVSSSFLASAGIAIPIAVFVFTLLSAFTLKSVFFSNLSKLKNRGLYISFILLGLFVLYATQFLSFMRVISIVTPYIAILFIYFFMQQEKYFFKFLKGYEVGLFSLVVFHFISIIIERYLYIDNWPLNSELSWLASSFFNYTIYQSLVSYSAVLSFFGIYLLFKIHAEYFFYKRVLYIMVLFMTYFILGYAARKAVLLDLIILVSVLLLLSTIAFARLKINKTYVSIVIFALFIIILLMSFSMFSERNISYATSINSRGHSYSTFLLFFYNGSLLEILFGTSNGEWGGYSNFIIELIVRLGVVSFLLYCLAIYYAFKEVLTLLRKRVHRNPIRNLKAWAMFVTISIAAANIVNMNFQLPYYTLNILLISFMYIYLPFFIKLEKNDT
jgi:hypothetical protein